MIHDLDARLARRRAFVPREKTGLTTSTQSGILTIVMLYTRLGRAGPTSPGAARVRSPRYLTKVS